MIDTIFLDLDGVVFNFAFAEREAVCQTLQAFGCPSDERVVARYSAINDGLWKAHERGEIDKATLKVERFRMLIDAFGFDADPIAMAASYIRALSNQGQLIEGAWTALRALKGRYRLFAVTNGVSEIQRGRLHAAGIESFFNGVFISEEMGAVKPQRQFYEQALSRSGAARDRVLVVGDSLTADIAGANAAGLKCCLIADTAVDAADYRIDFTFDSLKAFAEAVEAGEVV